MNEVAKLEHPRTANFGCQLSGGQSQGQGCRSRVDVRSSKPHVVHTTRFHSRIEQMFIDKRCTESLEVHLIGEVHQVILHPLLFGQRDIVTEVCRIVRVSIVPTRSFDSIPTRVASSPPSPAAIDSWKPTPRLTGPIVGSRHVFAILVVFDEPDEFAVTI